MIILLKVSPFIIIIIFFESDPLGPNPALIFSVVRLWASYLIQLDLLLLVLSRSLISICVMK